MSTVKNYTNLADIKKFWKENIAKEYLNFDNVNNYNLGVFGYINEVMGTAMEDGQNAINIARREFYPISAKYESSFYKMAATQRIELPMATPSVCNAILILSEDLVLEKGTMVDGVSQFVVDNTINIIADKLNFMLDYPIVILSMKQPDGTWSHTSHYDISQSNSLSTGANRYISNKSTRQNGANYIYLKVQMHQVVRNHDAATINVSAAIQSVVLDFPFTGQLANFEVRYVANDNTNAIQLKKLLSGQTMPKVPFCYYNLIGRNKIRITIPKNIYFIPQMNSRLEVDIYTTEGANGNFPEFTGSLVCETKSDKYIYNNAVIITGIIDGPAVNGKDVPDSADFKAEVLDAYATNKTFTTEHDLQVYFDSLDRGTDTKFVIKKKRDDFRYRLYGAFCLCRDSAHEIIPTNTLNLKIAPEQFNVYYQGSKRMILYPGTIFQYGKDESDAFKVYKDDTRKLIDDVEDRAPTDFTFTNPFLISVTLDPNVVGYYQNTVTETNPIEHSYVNDKSFVQFLANNLYITRNAIIGENYYKLTVALCPSNDMDLTELYTPVDTEDEANIIRAKDNGHLSRTYYHDKTVWGEILYSDGTKEEIQIGSYLTKDSDSGEYKCNPGSQMEVVIGEEFIKGSVLARRKISDKCKLRVVADIDGLLLNNDHYIPFTAEEVIEDVQYVRFAAYLSTNDYISLNKTLLIEHGIWDYEGNDNVSLSLPMENFDIDILSFYNNDIINYPHQYSKYDFFKDFTLTNTYRQRDEKSLRFIKPLSVVRGQVDFHPKSIIVENPDLITDSYDTIEFNYDLEIENVPLVKAAWCKTADNTKQFSDSMLVNVTKLEEARHRLENSHTFAMMLFNTYGKSRYFKIGIKDELESLNRVNCSVKLGVRLSSISAPDATINDIKKFVKDYIESINDLDSSGKSIFLLNLVSEIKTKFSEVEYIEYYGFNEYDYSAQKIQGPTEEEILAADAEGTYIPEFINIAREFDGFEWQPMVNIEILN